MIEHLDHIQRLGATALYLNPIFQSASNHRYHTFDYFAVDPLLGGDAALRELLDACHARGMRVVLDGVFNHASRGFWAFHHILENGLASPYLDWFFIDREALARGVPMRAYPLEPVELDMSAITPEQMSGRASLERYGYLGWWSLPALPKLNVANPEVREHLLQAAEHWIRFGADGWRLDVPREMPDDFWREFRRRVKAVDPNAYIVAEIWHEAPDDLHGDMYDAQMHYMLGAAITSFVGAGRLDRRVLDQHFTIGPNVHDVDAPTFAMRLQRSLAVNDPAVTGVQLNLLDSHDTPRFLSMVGGDTSALRLATLIQATVPGAPSIYYGDEIGMLGELDPLNRGAFPWAHPEEWDRGLYDDLSGALAARHARPVLRDGDLRVAFAEGHTVAYVRTNGAGADAALVVINADDIARRPAILVPELAGRELRVVPWRRSVSAATTSPVVPLARLQRRLGDGRGGRP